MFINAEISSGRKGTDFCLFVCFHPYLYLGSINVDEEFEPEGGFRCTSRTRPLRNVNVDLTHLRKCADRSLSSSTMRVFKHLLPHRPPTELASWMKRAIDAPGAVIAVESTLTFEKAALAGSLCLMWNTLPLI